MALVKKKRLHKIEMYADAGGVLQRVKVTQMWRMQDGSIVDEDIGERQRSKEFERTDTIPAAVKTAIQNRLT